jgi:hypothetical protein
MSNLEDWQERIAQIEAVMRGESLPEPERPRKRLTVYLTPQAALQKYQKEASKELRGYAEGALSELAQILANYEDTFARKWGETEATQQAMRTLKTELEQALHQGIATHFQEMVATRAGWHARERQDERECFGQVFKTPKEARRARGKLFQQEEEVRQRAREEEERLNPEIVQQRREEARRWAEASRQVEAHNERQFRAAQSYKPRYVELENEAEGNA